MLCWYNKIKISAVLDGDGNLGGRLQSHIANCRSCQHFYEVGASLARSASEVRSRGRLNDNIFTAACSGVKPEKAGVWRRYGTSVAAGILLTISLGLILKNPGPSQQTGDVIANGNLEIRALADLLNMGNLSIRSVTAGTGRSLDNMKAPLKGELALLSEDANAAFGSMLGCLPIDQEAQELWDAISATMN